MINLASMMGIGEDTAQRLKLAGIRGKRTLLTRGRTPEGRKQIAELSGIDEGLILKLLCHLDLMRISGIAEAYALLLEAVEVCTVAELAECSPDDLHLRLEFFNVENNFSRKIPTPAQVKEWIALAGSLPVILEL